MILIACRYTENIKQVSRIFRDRPEHPVDTAAWWVEYVLRHQNTSFLRPIGVTRTWYERRMLHVWGFVALVLSVSLTLICIALKMMLSLIFNKKVSQKIILVYMYVCVHEF